MHDFQKNLFWINASVTAKPGGNIKCEKGPINNQARIKFKFISAHRVTLFTGTNLNFFSVVPLQCERQSHNWKEVHCKIPITSLMSWTEEEQGSIKYIPAMCSSWKITQQTPAVKHAGWRCFALFCYFMSHLNQGRFHFLGETLELQGWLSMEEISLGVVKSFSVEASENRLEEHLSRTVCVAEPASGRERDWVTFELSGSPVLVINPQRELTHDSIWARMWAPGCWCRASARLSITHGFCSKLLPCRVGSWFCLGGTAWSWLNSQDGADLCQRQEDAPVSHLG